MFVDQSGLVLEFHRHEAYRCQGLPYFHTPGLIQHGYKECVCHQWRMYKARQRRLLTDEASRFAITNSVTQDCAVKECRTKFGLFECEDDNAPGVIHLCYCVQRAIGWLENLPEYMKAIQPKERYSPFVGTFEDWPGALRAHSTEQQ
jgi:hypothetical protein